MKKLLLVALLIILIVCVVAPSVATAASASTNKAILYCDGYVLYSSDMDGDGNPDTVRFVGEYFSPREPIPVIVEIYSSDEFTIDFWINGDSLTAEQLATRATLLDTFATVHNFITLVDNCANTQYNGVTIGKVQSDVNKYNAAKYGDTIVIAKETYEMLQIAQEMYFVTDGAFNPAVYRLVDLWGFSSRIWPYQNYNQPYDGNRYLNGARKLPDDKYVTAFSDADFTTFDQDKVILCKSGQGDEATYTVTKNVAPITVDGTSYDQWIDLGGIAKGYAVDSIKAMLDKMGIDRYFATAGSSSSAYGLEYDGQQTLFQTENPFAPGMPLLGFNVDKCLTSTSGLYIRKYVIEGVEYAHIIDGVTGYPAQTGLQSVSVVFPNDTENGAAKGDCLTTALTVMGRDGVVKFTNGYLKDNNIQIVAVYEPLNSTENKQILSNVNKDDIVYKGYGFDEFNWVLNKNDDGLFVYDGNATFGPTGNPYTVWIIVLSSVFGAGVIAIVVYHFVRGHKKALKNVQSARKEKPFKLADVGAYLVVVLLIVVLFAAFFTGKDDSEKNWQSVAVVDSLNGEQLFLYNSKRNLYEVNKDNVNGWRVDVATTAKGLTVTFTRDVGDDQFVNVLQITRGSTPSVKMKESNCSYHQDCVKLFGEVTASNGWILCNPHNLKITTN